MHFFLSKMSVIAVKSPSMWEKWDKFPPAAQFLTYYNHCIKFTTVILFIEQTRSRYRSFYIISEYFTKQPFSNLEAEIENLLSNSRLNPKMELLIK